MTLTTDTADGATGCCMGLLILVDNGSHCHQTRNINTNPRGLPVVLSRSSWSWEGLLGVPGLQIAPIGRVNNPEWFGMDKASRELLPPASNDVITGLPCAWGCFFEKFLASPVVPWQRSQGCYVVALDQRVLKAHGCPCWKSILMEIQTIKNGKSMMVQ